MSWLYMHFPDVILQDWLGDQEAAFAIVNPENDTLMHISPTAQMAGVEVDMSVGMASYLCNDLYLCPFQPERYQATLVQRALWAYQFSSQVCLDQSSPHPGRQGIWLNMDGMLRLFHGVRGYCDAVKKSCLEQQWTVSLAAAHTPLAARHLALDPVPWHSSDVSTEASLQTFAKQKLRHLAITELDQPHEVEEQIERLGIKTLGELLKLPLADIQHRISSELTLYLKRLEGQVVHPLKALDVPEHYQHSMHFIEEIEHRQGLLFPLQRLLGGLCGYLQHRQLTTRHLQLTLIHRNQPASEWLIHIAYPEHRLEEWLDICRYQLERHTLPAPVQELRLTVKQLLPLDSQQLTCFDELAESSDVDGINPSITTNDKYSLLNRLQARMEQQQLNRLTTTGDPRPEYAQQSLALNLDDNETTANNSAKSKNSKAAKHPPPRHQQRPLWLLDKPQPCGEPTDILSGPERIDCGWWDQKTVRRDYYIAREHGRVQWIFRNDLGDWFVQGYFS